MHYYLIIYGTVLINVIPDINIFFSTNFIIFKIQFKVKISLKLFHTLADVMHILPVVSSYLTIYATGSIHAMLDEKYCTEFLNFKNTLVKLGFSANGLAECQAV